MNARQASEENQLLINQLVEVSQRIAKRKNISIDDAIDYGVDVRIAQSTTEAQIAAWELRGEEAKKICTPPTNRTTKVLMKVPVSENVHVYGQDTGTWRVTVTRTDVELLELLREQMLSSRYENSTTMCYRTMGHCFRSMNENKTINDNEVLRLKNLIEDDISTDDRFENNEVFTRVEWCNKMIKKLKNIKDERTRNEY